MRNWGRGVSQPQSLNSRQQGLNFGELAGIGSSASASRGLARLRSSCRHHDAKEDHSNSTVYVRIGDVVEQQQFVDYSVYETIVPFRRKPFRALLYERDLFAGQSPWSQLIMAVSLRVGMVVSKGRRIVFWFALAICSAGLLILGRWWLALAIFGGGLLILWWKEYVEPRSGLPTSDARDC